ncbi:MAG: bifunctional diaminohydroxyphosphoribosylaminopyrimidine deaminase/5-amino-6-(5-phosphoribosylamino)uracil reductase RibD [Myxococcales bacterium FL481]|nr:MAG: bifunctional diaminohydroxyphosphoribosylaminopyrimidine deaminase/5-amino-6-(5-phosphoribosylamino)uracil reductase RibD [Myxococcales bacterium FL481]
MTTSRRPASRAGGKIGGLAPAAAAAVMRRALRLARAGTGATYPNPCVGAVVVSPHGDILGAARSGPTGTAHAEVRALKRAAGQCRGATLFVTLEPCSHVGRTPPCTRAILEAGIARVVTALRDPAPHVSGRGIAMLRRGGVQVQVGFEAELAAEVHAHYLHHIATGRPWVTLKAATSLDGQLACASGDSRWITGVPARRHGHRQRARHHAILVGRGTMVADRPRLDVRLVRGTDPLPIVLDSRLRLAGPDAPLLRPGTVVVHGPRGSERARNRLAKLGVETIAVDADSRGRVDIEALLDELGRREIRSVLVEGGGEVLASFLLASAWQRFLLYQAPRLLGAGRPMLPGLSWSRVANAPALIVHRRQRLGDDTLLELLPPESE